MDGLAGEAGQQLAAQVRNVCKMLQKRGYHVLDGWDRVSTVAEVREKLSALESLDDLQVRGARLGAEEKVAVFFPQALTFNVKVLKASAPYAGKALPQHQPLRPRWLRAPFRPQNRPKLCSLVGCFLA